MRPKCRTHTDGDAFPRELVDDTEHPKCLPIVGAVGDEVVGPHMVICTAIAVYKRESAVSRNLGHWDEAAFLLMLCLGVHFIIGMK